MKKNILFAFVTILCILTKLVGHEEGKVDLSAYYEINFTNMENSTTKVTTDHLHLGLFPKIYKGEPLTQLEENMVLECAKELLMEKKSPILDFGCGTGGPILTILTQEPDLKIVGIDLLETCVNRANHLLQVNHLEKKCQILKMDGHHTSFKENTYDGVFLIEALEHMNQPIALKEIYRVIKNSGRLSFCVFCLTDRLTKKEKIFLENEERLHLLNKDDYLHLLHCIGFKNVEVTDLTNRVLPNFFYFFSEEEKLRKLISRGKVGYIKITAIADKPD